MNEIISMKCFSLKLDLEPFDARKFDLTNLIKEAINKFHNDSENNDYKYKTIWINKKTFN